MLASVERQVLTVPVHSQLVIGTVQTIYRQAARFVLGEELRSKFYADREAWHERVMLALLRETAPGLDAAERRIVETLVEAETPFSQRQTKERVVIRTTTLGAAPWTSMRERCVRCENETPQGTVNSLLGRSSAWGMKAVETSA